MTKNQTKKIFDNLQQNMQNMQNSQNKSTYFVSDEFNYDAQQSIDMLKNKQQMVNKVESNKVKDNGLNSITDAKDYLGCLNGNCSLGEENSNAKNAV